MKKRNIFKNIFLVSFAAVLILTAGIGKASAYFTTYARAAGGYRINIDYDTEIEEKFSDWKKRVVIKNKDGSQPVYVRARAFCGEEYSLTYSGDKWTLGKDGYWYYNDILYGGSQTAELVVKIDKIPEGVEEAELNVVVIYEYTPVKYNQDGKPYADWTERGKIE